MAGFVPGHLVDGVVDGVIAELLRAGGDGELAFAGAGLGFVALLEVRLGVPDDFAEEFGDAGGMVRFLEGITLEGVGNLRVALAFGLPAHREIHAHLRAFALEVVLQSGPDLRVAALGDTEFMLAGPHGLAGLFLDFDELFGLRVAHGALGGRVLAFMDITAD